MAIAFVQKLAAETTSTTNNATIALTTTAAGGVGHFLVGFVAQRLTGAFVASSISGGSLTWSVDKTEPGGTAISISIFSAQIPTGLASGTTVTVTLAGSTTRKVMGLYEFSGVDTSSPLGISAVNTSTTGNPNTTLASNATAGDLVFGAYQHNATGTTGTQSPFSGFTNLGSNVAGTSSWCEGYAQYAIDATGIQDASGYTPSVDTTTSWAGAVVCYHAAAAPIIRRHRHGLWTPQPIRSGHAHARRLPFAGWR